MVQKDNVKLSCLIIEDNAGDFLLISDFLEEKFLEPIIHRAGSLKEAKQILSITKGLDVIFLDLGLPDKSGLPLIIEITELAENTPIIIVTGHESFDFSYGAFGLGASDYLTKDELTAAVLYKSTKFSLERKKFSDNLKESKWKYSCIFHSSPMPEIIFRKDLSIFDCNKYTVMELGEQVGSLDHLSLLFVEEDRNAFNSFIQDPSNQDKKKIFHLLDQHGGKKICEVKFSLTGLDDEFFGVLCMVDITEKVNKTAKIQEQYQKLKEISWIQSHIVRAPLARLMGLANMIKENMIGPEETGDIMDMILKSCEELDQVIHDITAKSNARKEQD